MDKSLEKTREKSFYNVVHFLHLFSCHWRGTS